MSFAPAHFPRARSHAREDREGGSGKPCAQRALVADKRTSTRALSTLAPVAGAFCPMTHGVPADALWQTSGVEVSAGYLPEGSGAPIDHHREEKE